jgi:glycosyltransferase involved in cell wall biosynthesis
MKSCRATPHCAITSLPVINSNVFSNPYQKLLYSAIGSSYRVEKGSPKMALEALRRDGRGIFHIHWEESELIHCDTQYTARRARDAYLEQLGEYCRAGGTLVWTVHNLLPHELKYVQTFTTFRRRLAALASRILVHNEYAIEMLARQVGGLDRSKVRVLPHPSYLGEYEPVDATLAGIGSPPADPDKLLFFGKIRAYKGVPGLLKKLPASFTAAHGIRLEIRGQPLRAGSVIQEIETLARDRTELAFDFRRVAASAVPQMFRSVGAVVLPYNRFLTSGVAVLGLTLGIPVVAPDVPQMRELFPSSCHGFLFQPRSVKALHRSILTALRLSADSRRSIAEKSIRRAQQYSPRVISAQLGQIYDEALREGRSGRMTYGS